MGIERKFLIPVEGRTIRKPGEPRLTVKKTGELLPYNTYYRRRVLCGDMTIKEDTKSKAVSKKESI